MVHIVYFDLFGCHKLPTVNVISAVWSTYILFVQNDY